MKGMLLNNVLWQKNDGEDKAGVADTMESFFYHTRGVCRFLCLARVYG